MRSFIQNNGKKQGDINTAEDNETTRAIKPAQPIYKNDNQTLPTPAVDPALDMTVHTPFNSPGMHRLAKNRSTPTRHPMGEMSDFEKETEMKNAHFVKRLANARQQIGKSHS